MQQSRDRQGVGRLSTGQELTTREQLIRALEQWGIEIDSLEPYVEAFTHSSYVHEAEGELTHNERLEFLGDAVLELIVSSYLFERFPELPEGDLTRMRAALVCSPTLARCARRLDLGRYALVSKGEAENEGRQRTSFLADVFEALTGAIYVDRGLQAAQRFVLVQLQKELVELESKDRLADPKSILQEWHQRGLIGHLRYRVVDEWGPDHAKTFVVQVLIDDEVWGQAEGRSKKRAEKAAAKLALDKLEEMGLDG